MIRKCTLDEISDGRLYEENDMVKAYCNECKGCHSCCENMGDSIILDPLDVHRLTVETGRSFEQMLNNCIELGVVDGIVLPHIKMVNNRCSFLNEEMRCSIHENRPGFCRLFPLGRYYDGDGFKYFLQIHECERAGKVKVKVSKWVDTPDLAKNTEYINSWHKFQKSMQQVMQQLTENESRNLNMLLLQGLYISRYTEQTDFYEQFEMRLNKLRLLIEQN